MAEKLSLKPRTKPAEDVTPEEFIAQANNHPLTKENRAYPWEDPKVREDVIKAVSLRMPEPYILKLQYLSEKTHKSQQELMREVLLPWLDEEVVKY